METLPLDDVGAAVPEQPTGKLLWPALVTLGALLIRVASVLAQQDSPFFDHLLLNAREYDQWARLGFPADQPYFQAPLFVIFLQGLYSLVDEDARLLTTRLVQCVLGAVTCGLVYGFLARRASRVAALIAATLVALHGALVFYDGEILPTSLSTFLFTGGLLVTWKALEEERPTLATMASGGGLLGLAGICRPNLLLAAAWITVALAWRWFTHSPRDRAKRGAAFMVFLVTLGIPVGAVTIRNLGTGEGFVLVTANFGQNLWLGNNPEADGMSPFPPPPILQAMTELQQAGASQAERSRFASAQAQNYLSNSPGPAAVLAAKKALWFFHRHEIPNNRSFQESRQLTPLLSFLLWGGLGLGLLFPLAVAGLGSLWSDRRLLGIHGLAVLASGPVSVAPFLVCARFRTPYVPFLACLAGFALHHAWTRRRSFPWKLPALAALGGLLCWPNWADVIGQSEFPELAVSRASAYQQLAADSAGTDQARSKQLIDQAIQTLQVAIEQHPTHAELPARLGDLFHALQRQKDAETQYLRSLQLDPRQGRVLLMMANLRQRQGDREQAMTYLRQALASKALTPAQEKSARRLLEAADSGN